MPFDTLHEIGRKSRLPDTHLCRHQPPNLLWGCHPYFDLFVTALQRRPGKVMFSVMSVSQSACLFTRGPHVTTTNNAMGQWQITWNPLPPIQSYSKLFTWDLQGLASHMETPSALALDDYVHYVTHISVDKLAFGLRQKGLFVLILLFRLLWRFLVFNKQTLTYPYYYRTNTYPYYCRAAKKVLTQKYGRKCCETTHYVQIIEQTVWNNLNPAATT